MVFIIWAVGAARRSIDTRAFARMYAELAVPVIAGQRKRGVDNSAINARVTLSRELIDFFEHDLPAFLTATASVVGTVVMLIIIEFWVGIMTLAALLLFAVLLPRIAASNNRYYRKLNNRLEKEVHLVAHAQERELNKHYSLAARLRILISDREAAGYFAIGTALFAVFGAALTLLSHKQTSAGHIYAVLTYLWTFATRIDSAPYLLEQYANLKDIGKRVDIGETE